MKNRTIQRLRKTYGNWALVTGATSGIGKELAFRLAESGFNLVVTGRREERLNAICTNLFDQFGIEAIPIVGDLSRESDVSALVEETKHLPLGIVILNAGFGTSGTFMTSDVQTEMNMLDLNCKAVLLLSHHFVNKMKGSGSRGAIVLLSSMVAFQGVPFAANYAASKAYVQTLGEGLAREVKSHGIDILCAAPGPVKSEFADRANMQMGMSLKPEDIGSSILSSIGKRTTILPGFLTKLLVYNLRMTPRWAKTMIMGNVMGGFTKHQLQSS